MSLSPIISKDSPEPKISDVCLNLETQFIDDFNDANDMQVFVRVRPMQNSEIKAGYKECLEIIDDQTLRAVVPASSTKYKNESCASQDVNEDFKFTATFGPEAGQLVFFERSMMNTLRSFIEGQNNLVFSYGTSESGKTFTLQGDAVDPGIIPLSLHLFFTSIEDQLLDRIVNSNKVNEVCMLSDNEMKEQHQLLEKLLLKNDREEKSNENLNAILCKTFSHKFENGEVESTLIPKDIALAQAAALMKEMVTKSAHQQTGYCSVWISFVEVYNECVYDLLQSVADEKTELTLDEDENGEVYLKGLREVCVFNSNDALKLLNLGQKNLRTAPTELNHQSSRSHCIFTIKVVRISDPDNITDAKVSRLSFCDLADSERTVKSETGVHLKKTGYENTSLDVLGRCLEQLRLNSSLKDKKQMPFQESKLTHLLSGFFTDRSKKVMIMNASPSEFTLDETLRALRFSALATELNINDSYIATASTTLQTITNTWTSAKANVTSVSDKSIDFDDSYTEALQEKDELIEKLVDLAESLTNNLAKEKKEKVEMERKIRREVCDEYSQFCEELLEDQRKAYEEKEEAVIKTYQEKITAIELMYEDVIKKYEMQTEQKDSVSNGHISMEFDTLEYKGTVGAEESFKEKILENDCKEEGNKGESFLPGTEELLHDLNISRGDIDSISEELRKIKEELEKSKDFCSSLENVNEELEKRIEAALVENNELKTKIDLLASNQDIVDPENNSNYQPVDKTEHETLKENFELLKSELEALKIDCVSYKVDNDDLFKKKVTLEEKLKSLSEEFESAKLENQDFYQKLTDSEKNVADLKEEVKQLLEKTNDLVKLRDESDAEHRISLEKSERRAKEAEIVLESVNQTLSNALILTEEQKMKLETFEAESADFKDRIAKIQEENKELKENYDVVSKELESVKLENQSLHQKLTDSEENVADLKEEVKKLLEKTSDLVKLRDELDAEHRISLEKSERRAKEAEIVLESVNQTLSNALILTEEQKMKLETFEAESAEFKDRIAKIQEENKELKENYDVVTKDLESAKLENQNLHQNLTDSERNVADLKEEVKQLLEKTSDLEKLWDESDAEHRISLEKSERRAKEAEIVLESVNQTLSNALKVTEEQKIKLETIEAESAAFNDRIAKIQEENKELKEEYVVLSKELEIKKTVYEQKLDAVKSELELALLNVEKQKTTIEQLVMNKNPYEDEISELKMSKKELEDHLSFITAQNETEIMAYQKELDVANSKLAEALSSLDNQKQELDNLANIIDADKEEIAKLQKENEELLLKNNVHESEKLAYEEELDTLNSKLVETLCALDKQKLEVQNLKNATDSDRIKIAELLEQNEKLKENYSSNIGSEKGTLEEELSSVNSKLAEALCSLDKQNQEMEKLRNKIESDEKKTADLKEQNEELKEKLNLGIESEKTLKGDLDSVKTNLAGALSTLDEQTKEIESLKSVTVSDSNKIAELQKKNDDLLKNSNSEIETEKEALKVELDTVNSKLAESLCALEKQNQTVESLRNEVDTRKSKLAELHQQNEELLQKLNSLTESDGEALKKELNSVNSKLTEALSTLDKQNQEVESLKTVINSDQKLIAELQKQNGELQEKLISETGPSLIYEMIELLGKCEFHASIKINKIKLELEKLIAEAENSKQEIKKNSDHHEAERNILHKMIQILQKCEYFATSKTKDLHTSSIKHVEQIMDLKNCINQKEGSIDKLENDCNQLQKNLMDSQSAAKKQLQTEKQLKADIDGLLKAKTNLEKNNKDLVHHIVQLKSKLAKKEAWDNKCKKANDKPHVPQKEQNKENHEEKSTEKIIDDKKTSKKVMKEQELINLDDSEDSTRKHLPERKATKKAKNEQDKQIADSPTDSVKKSSAKKTAKKGKKEQEQISLDNSKDSSKEHSPEIKAAKKAKKEQEQHVIDNPRISTEKSSAKKTSKKEKNEVELQNTDDSKGKMSVEKKTSKVKDNRKKKSDENSGSNAENKKPKTKIYEEVNENNADENKKKLKITTRRQLRNVENVTPLKSQNLVNDNKTKGSKRKEINDSPDNKLSEKNVLKKIKLENVENIIKPLNPRIQLLKVNVRTDNISMPSPRMTRGRKMRLNNANENLSQNKENSRRVRS